MTGYDQRALVESGLISDTQVAEIAETYGPEASDRFLELIDAVHALDTGASMHSISLEVDVASRTVTLTDTNRQFGSHTTDVLTSGRRDGQVPWGVDLINQDNSTINLRLTARSIQIHIDPHDPTLGSLVDAALEHAPGLEFLSSNWPVSRTVAGGPETPSRFELRSLPGASLRIDDDTASELSRVAGAAEVGIEAPELTAKGGVVERVLLELAAVRWDVPQLEDVTARLIVLREPDTPLKDSPYVCLNISDKDGQIGFVAVIQPEERAAYLPALGMTRITLEPEHVESIRRVILGHEA